MKHIFHPDDTPDISKIKPIVFDTNVWIYVLFPSMCSGKPGSEKYTDLFQDLKDSGIRIHLDIVIYQEFLNAVLSAAFRDYRVRYGKNPSFCFKDYRKTENFEKTLIKLSELLHTEMFPNIICVSPYDTDSFDRLLQSNRKMNTNDAHITKFCRDNGCFLVTHDSDFSGEDIDIVTANRNFFKNRNS